MNHAESDNEGAAMTTRTRIALSAVLLFAGFPLTAMGGPCDAYYSFDGNLSDASGSYNGTMIGKEGMPALAQFSDGIDGQALQLDGRSAMRAFLDLNPETCPQITITAWIRVEHPAIGKTRYIVSTGSGGGPSLWSSGAIARLSGNGNGLSHRDAIRDGRAWFFFACVYDYKAKTYRFHWRDRVVEGNLPESSRPPEDAFWVGAFNDRLDYALVGGHIDELRITGKVLSSQELVRMRGSRPGAVVMLEGAGSDDDATTVADTGGGSSSASTISTDTPQSVQDIVDGFGATRPDIDPDSLPDRPPNLLAGGLGTSDDSGPLMEVPDEVIAANEGRIDPELTPMDTTFQDQVDELTQPREPPPPTSSPNVEVYRLNAQGPIRTIDIMLPGETDLQTITYMDVDGVAVVAREAKHEISLAWRHHPVHVSLQHDNQRDKPRDHRGADANIRDEPDCQAEANRRRQLGGIQAQRQ